MWMEVPTMHYAPKKVIQQYWDIDKRKSRPQALAKQKYALGETSSKVTSHPKDPQPRLIQLPLLLQKGRQVVHGGQRVRMIRTEVRFAPCKRSAVQGLRLASRDGTGGVGPQAWIRLRVPCGKGRKVGNGLEFGLMKKMSSTIIPCK